jgi:hypothetical protein
MQCALRFNRFIMAKFDAAAEKLAVPILIQKPWSGSSKAFAFILFLFQKTRNRKCLLLLH